MLINPEFLYSFDLIFHTYRLKTQKDIHTHKHKHKHTCKLSVLKFANVIIRLVLMKAKGVLCDVWARTGREGRESRVGSTAVRVCCCILNSN